MHYIVITQHRTEYPDPLIFNQGATLTIGDKYAGPEGWDNWFFCTTGEHPGGWVPGQIIENIDNTHGIAREDFCTRELDVDVGQMLLGLRCLNGWQWCRRLSDEKTGWVPMENLAPAPDPSCASATAPSPCPH